MPDEYELVCPFLTDSPEFAAGFRLANFWCKVRKRRPKVKELVAEGDEEQFRLAASRCGYSVETRADVSPGWFRITYRQR